MGVEEDGPSRYGSCKWQLLVTTLAQGQNGGPNDKRVEEDGPSRYGSGKWQLLVIITQG